MSTLNEEVMTFGPERQLVGIFSPNAVNADAPVVLMMNAGYLHRVGPFRLWVDLARQLAEQGIPSLRFDLAGLGDSASAREDSNAVKNAVDCLVAAMDDIERRIGKRQFIVTGLCSGADYAHPAAKADSRIRGVVFIDGYGYRTRSYSIHHQLKRALSPRRWKNLISGAWSRDERVPAMATSDVRDFPPAAQVENELITFLEEGRRLYFIYTAGVPEYFSYEQQFWDMFPKLKPHAGLRYQYYPKTDHTFALVQERAELAGQILSFVTHKQLNISPRD
jgi:hypothetical protein